MNEHDEDLSDLAQKLAEYITMGLGTRSRWALRTALDAAQTEGIPGVIVLQVPSKVKDFAEVSFTAGTVELVSRWA